MHPGPVARVAGLAVVVVLGACTTQPPMTHVGPSVPASACAEAFAEMRRAAGTVPVDLAEPAGRAVELVGLDGCADAAEWVAAAAQDPALVGAADAAAVDETFLAERCRTDLPELRAARVCADAVATGLVP